MHKEAREELQVRFKLTVLEYANRLGATKACQEFNAIITLSYNNK